MLWFTFQVDRLRRPQWPLHLGALKHRGQPDDSIWSSLLMQQQGVKTDDLYSGRLSLTRMAPGIYIVYCVIGEKVHSLGKIAKY